MKEQKTATITKNAFPFLNLPVSIATIFMGVFFSFFSGHTREYSVGDIATANPKETGDKRMQQFFFNARKNITTNQMDYQSMLAADIADRAMSNLHKAHAASVSPLPAFNWISMGPTNMGGRTRAVLIDNTDPTHKTIFAAGVSGGVWKSTNGGGTWGNTSATISFSQEDTMQNINVCSLAQDSKGAIYAGTGEGFSDYDGGEGFSTAILGAGIFKSTDDGKTWRLLPNTAPSVVNNNTVNWAYVNRIAIRPDSFQVIYAATNRGLMISHDSGTTWNYAVNSANNLKMINSSLDVKVSNDGSVVVAFSNDNGFYCYPQSGNSNLFTQIKSTGAGRLPGNVARIEFAFSPTDPNRIYAADVSGFSDTGSIYMTMTGKTNGGYWYRIGIDGSLQSATYAATLGVPPANEAQVLWGSTTLSEWSGSSLTDTIGSWAQVSHAQPYYEGDPLWIHNYLHAIVFDNNNPQTVYIGCNGGLFKCSNLYLNPNNINGNGTGSISNLSFEPINRNYDVTQYYSVCYSPQVHYETVNYGNSTMPEGLGLGGGAQDLGSPYINGTAFAGYPNDATDLSGGDGGGSAASQLNPNIAYFSSDYGTLLKESLLNNLASPTNAYTETKGYNIGGNIDSVWQESYSSRNVCFVFPVALYENPYDTLNRDSLLFINSTDSNYQVGNTIWPKSANGEVPYPYVLAKPLGRGDTISVPDRVVSRLAIGFSPSYGGIWINGQGASTGVPIWMPIAGPLSKPDAYTSTNGDAIHAITWTSDGNTLFAGTEAGTFFRFSNINSIIANSYKSGALWSNTPGGIFDTTNQVVSTNLNSALGVTGRDILSISVDPTNGNNVIVTLGNYNNTKYILYSSNALAAAPTFTPVQGNLPAMPVYSSILDIMDSNGHYISGSAMIGTEHGIYTTVNINQGSNTKWVKSTGGMANVLTLALKQQTLQPWLCNNAGIIYAGTHGRGLWSSNTEYQTPTGIPDISTTKNSPGNLLVYPNPMTTEGTIQYTLGATDNITITLYDMQGRIIKVLNVGEQSEGSHSVALSTSGIPEGTYFVSLTGSTFRKTDKVIILK